MRYKISHWKGEPRNIFREVSRTLKCDPKKFPTELKNAKSIFFLDRILAFDSPAEKIFIGSRCQWEIFIASVRDRTLARNSLTRLGFFVGLDIWGCCSKLQTEIYETFMTTMTHQTSMTSNSCCMLRLVVT